MYIDKYNLKKLALVFLYISLIFLTVGIMIWALNRPIIEIMRFRSSIGEHSLYGFDFSISDLIILGSLSGIVIFIIIIIEY